MAKKKKPTSSSDTIPAAEAEDVVVSSVFHTTQIIDNAPPPAAKTIPIPTEELLGSHRAMTEPESASDSDEAMTAASAEETAVEASAPQKPTVSLSEEAIAAYLALPEEEKEKMRRDNAEFALIDESWDNPYHNVFVDSLENVTADDLGTPQKKKKKDPVDVAIGVFRQLIFYAAVVAFFVSGFQIVSKLYAYQQSEDIYDFDDIFNNTERREDLVAHAVKDSVLQAMTPVNGTREESGELTDSADNREYNEKLLLIQGQLQILRNKNKEIVGWIEMPGDTEVNYPVVQGKDNDWYLHYAYDGTYNPAGSIYLDCKNKVTMSSNRHAIIYGHNMESGSPMFANLLHYRDPGYWQNNRYINIYTDEALYTYEVFAAYETDPSQTKIENHAWRMNFKQDDKVFLDWISYIRSRSDISPNVTIEAKDRILTLSTCMNINENRYVVHAVLVEVVK